MANVNADTEKLKALKNSLYNGQQKFKSLNNDMNERLKTAHSVWQDDQYNLFYKKFERDVYQAIEDMCGEIGIFQEYLGTKIQQLERYLETKI